MSRSRFGAMDPGWMALIAMSIIGVASIVWIARWMAEIEYPVPTEAHRVRLNQELHRDFGVTISVRSVVHIDLDRSGMVALLEEDKVESVVSRIYQPNRSGEKVERLGQNLFRTGARFYRFEKYKAGVLVVWCHYWGYLDDLRDAAESRGLLDEAYRKKSQLGSTRRWRRNAYEPGRPGGRAALLRPWVSLQVTNSGSRTAALQGQIRVRSWHFGASEGVAQTWAAKWSEKETTGRWHSDAAESWPLEPLVALPFPYLFFGPRSRCRCRGMSNNSTGPAGLI